MQRAMKWLLSILASIAFLGGGFVVLRGSMPPASINAWLPVGNLSAPRSGAASVLLQDGRLLITGGNGATGALATTDIMDASGVFTPGPPMNFARSNHIAVALEDGRVLVAGGTGADGRPADTAEIFDPATNAWSSAGLLLVPRSGATATLLADGRVLIAGGASSGGPTNTLEAYNPVSGSFTAAAGVLSSSRENHAAALLSDGRVLIVGGSNGIQSLASSDIFDPSIGAVSPGPALRTARSGLTCTTLLDGTVLVAGGTTMAQDGSLQDLASLETLSPGGGAFSAAAASLAAPRTGQSAFRLPNNNGVLFVGGTSNGAAASTSELYLPWLGAFGPAASLSGPRNLLTGSPLATDGALLVAGGSDGTTSLATTEVYGFATIKSDKADYAPGETAIISGSGWQPGEVVQMSLVEVPDLDADSPIPLTATADDNGNFSNVTVPIDVADLNIRFTLTAVGAVSQAQTVFTDAQPGTIALSPSSVSVAPGGSAVWTNGVTVTQNGSSSACTITYSVTTALPTGAIATFSPNPQTMTSANLTASLTITTTGATPPGSYPFTIFASRGSNCQGTTGTGPTTTGTLVVFGAADHLAFGAQPTNTQAGSSIAPPVTVQVLDSGNRVVATSSASIGLAIGNNPGSGTLSGGGAVNAVNGVATFSSLSIDKVGTGYTLTASDGVTGATSNSFNITLAPASQLVFSVQPGGANTGSPLSPQPQVSVEDQFGNVITTGQGNSMAVTLTIVPLTGTAGALLTCTTNPLTSSGGVANFAGCSINTAGTGYKLRASVSAGFLTTSVDSNAFDITSSDSDSPVVSVTFDAPDGLNNWHKTSPVSGSVSATDPSNVASISCTDTLGGLTLGALVGGGTTTASRTLSLTGDGIHEVSCQATDGAGNGPGAASGSTTMPVEVKIDTVAPTLTLVFTPDTNDGTNGWWKTVGGVPYAWTCSDATSGIDSSYQSGCPSPLTGTVTAQGTTNFTHQVRDQAGNLSVEVNRDLKLDNVAPVISLNSAADICSLPGLNGWCRGTQTAGFTATDATSGLAGGSPYNFTQLTGTNGSAVNIPSGTVTDLAGNTASSIDAGPYKIDSVAPTITAGTPPSGSPYLLGQSVTPSFTCNDLTSGFTSASGGLSTSGPNGTDCTGPATVDTSTVGDHTYGPLNAMDVAGNTATPISPGYHVNFGFAGLFDPYAPPPMRAYKVKSAVPLKWDYTNMGGMTVPSPNAAPQVKIFYAGSCSDSAVGTEIVDVTASGNSGYQYDSLTYLWQFNWKTTGWAPGCYSIQIYSAQTGQTNPSPTGGFLIQLVK